MGKTPKKAAPGGDERNLYLRRLKATTSLSSKGCDTNLTVKQRESDNSNRAKAAGVQKRLPVPAPKVFKSKLRALKTPTRFRSTSGKDEKNPAPAATSKSQDTEVTTMYTETEESAVQLKVSITKREIAEEDGKSASQRETVKSEKEPCAGLSNLNGKETSAESREAEMTSPRAETPRETRVTDSVGTEASRKDESSVSEKLENGNESSETIKNDEENEAGKEESDVGGCESDENSLKLVDEPEAAPRSSNEEKVESGTKERSERVAREEQEEEEEVEEEEEREREREREVAEEDEKEKKSEDARETRREKEETPKTENRSADDVVESTTSEISEISDSARRGPGRSTEKDSEARDDEDTKESRVAGSAINEASFVSYDSSIMLKDVQIKLNDCLKENSKLFEVSTVEEPQKRLDMSFGKTLRNISGRSTINRLRYVTVREHRFSPNSSLFVNTSSASLDPDDSTGNKLARYSSDIAESIIRNGSPLERKRKLADNAAAATKKFKTDASSLLDTSLEMLKSIRRPVEVSTPNNRACNFKPDKFNRKTFNDDKSPIDADVEPKKWCVVM